MRQTGWGFPILFLAALVLVLFTLSQLPDANQLRTRQLLCLVLLLVGSGWRYPAGPEFAAYQRPGPRRRPQPAHNQPVALRGVNVGGWLL